MKTLSEELKLNIDKIDEQHSRWLSIYGELHDMADDEDFYGDYAGRLKIIVAKMYEYARTHLKYEERFMEKINYPDFSEHKAEHRKLDKTISDLYDKIFKENRIEKEELLLKTREWLEHHIMDHDKKIARFVFENDIDYRSFLD